MAYNVGQAEVTILPNAERFNEILGPQLTERAREIGRDMGDQIADRIRERLALLGDVNIGVDTTKAGLEVDKFLAETKVKSEIAGDEAGKSLGNNLSKSAAQSGKGASPLIVGAVAGGLMEGAPVLLAAAGIMFAGIAAAAVHSNAQAQAAFDTTKTQIESTFTSAAQVTVPMFVSALQRIGAAVQGLGPQFHTAFAALGGPIDSLTTGLISLMTNVMPGLVSAVQAAGPVFQGLASLMASIGTGLSQLFSIISQHSQAAGTAFSALGSIVGALLPILGELVGAGAELAANILPPVASALRGVADALHFLAPVLPGVLAGLLGFKAVTMLAGPLDSLAAKLTGMGGIAGRAGGALTSLSGALPLVGIALGAVTAGFQLEQQQIDKWAQALLDGGQAAAAATAEMQKQAEGLGILNNSYKVQGVAVGDVIGGILGYGNVLSVANRQQALAAEAAKEQYAAMSPLQQRTQDLVKATNDLGLAQKTYGVGSKQATLAAGSVAEAQGRQKAAQDALKAATDAALPPEQRQQAALQAIADKASAGSTQINLLKGALDALTGKAVTADQAEIAITQAVNNAMTATKGQTGALVGVNGQLDLHSTKGAAAAQALMNLASAQHQDIAVMEQQGAKTDVVSAKTDALRGQFISVAQSMGFSAAQAKALADRYFGIPKDVHTNVDANTGQAIGAIDSVLTALARVQNKTVTITTVTQGFHVSGGGGPGGTQVAGAIGGIVHPYAAGGIEPMKGGIAQIVPPDTLRVIGDRIKDDEAYIPINRDLRSIAIWRQAGERMGQLSAVGAGGGGGSARGSFTGNLYLDSGEFLGKVRGVASTEVDRAFGQVANSVHYAGSGH